MYAIQAEIQTDRTWTTVYRLGLQAATCALSYQPQTETFRFILAQLDWNWPNIGEGSEKTDDIKIT